MTKAAEQMEKGASPRPLTLPERERSTRGATVDASLQAQVADAVQLAMKNIFVRHALVLPISINSLQSNPATLASLLGALQPQQVVPSFARQYEEELQQLRAV